MYGMNCPCGVLHWPYGCDDYQQAQRARWCERRQTREAAQGFRYINVETPWWARKRPRRELEPLGVVQGTTGDLVESFR